MKVRLKSKLSQKFYKLVSKSGFSDFNGYKNMNVSNLYINRQLKKLDHYFNTFDKENLTDFALFNQSYIYHLGLFNEISKLKMINSRY